MEEELIREALRKSINQLLRSDSEILINDINERSISHKLAIYLEPYFQGWNIDCEYNRNHDNPKRLEITKRNIQSDDTQATTVYPDIIIHHRGTNDNLVVIEMKKTTSNESDDYDIGKLRAFKNQLGYQFAIFIKVRTKGQAGIEDTKLITEDAVQPFLY